MESAAGAEANFRGLLDLIARLRSAEGCPWDRSRTLPDMARYLIDEAYEVVEAIDGDSPPAIREELGDLLFQILFIARMAEEAGDFDIAAVLAGISEKMIRRHPHVFGDVRVDSVEDVRLNWEQIKREQEHKGNDVSRLEQGIPRTLPTLAKVQLITGRAAKVGFDWSDAGGVLAKLDEEIDEFNRAREQGDRKALAEEAGDLLFTLVNLCRFAGVDAEAALRTSLGKFTRRFAYIERALAAEGRRPADATPAEMDRLWNEAKTEPTTGAP
ncbi:MAG: nucleoside triphosphate pyrophosphohydrolase [Syntrophales bacterium]